jgi:hypothetical protein
MRTQLLSLVWKVANYCFLSRLSGNFSKIFFFSGIQTTFLHFIYSVIFKSLTFISGLCRRVWLLDVAIYKMKCQVGPRPKEYDNLFPNSFLSIGKLAERLRVWTNGHHSHSRNVTALLATNVSITTPRCVYKRRDYLGWWEVSLRQKDVIWILCIPSHWC